ncbi:MAG TPA: cupredoxin domain-containing protein [Puia sp.]|jgi:plastocyanin|nr:cupredoxin domain-containing protein [Puia sp.]
MKKRSFLTGSLMILLVAIAMLMVACSKSNNNGNANNNSAKVYMKNSVFSNTNLQIAMGTTVTWINDDTAVHTVTADNGSFDSGNINPGGSFNWTFSSVGTFAYHSKLQTGMTGIVVVASH